MIRRLLVYWQCPRHVMSLGGYPGRISPWLVVLPHPCCVQPPLHSCVCGDTAASWRGPGTAAHCFGLSAQELRHSPWYLGWRGRCVAKGKAEQNSRTKMWGCIFALENPGVADPLKSLLQKSVWPQQFRGHGLLRVLKTSLRPARWHTIMGHQKCKTRPEKERFAGHLHPRNLLVCPKIQMGWSTLDSPRVSSHYSLSSQKVKMLFPAKEGRQPNQVQTTPSIPLLSLKPH